VLQVGDDERFRVEFLPPKSCDHPWFVMRNASERMDDTHWLVFVGREQIARASSREEAEREITNWASAR